MAKKKKKEEEKKSYTETCAPKDNGCTNGGTGPNCMDDPDVGGQDKRECLKDAEENCEKTLEKCIKACEAQKEARKQSAKDFITRYNGGNVYLHTGTLTSCGRDDVSWGRAYDHVSMQPESWISGIAPTTNRSRWQRQEYATCLAYCYRIAADNCETSQCYCSSYKCQGPSVTPNGVGGTTGPEEPTEEDPKYVDKYAHTNTANYDTTSNYGLPIELVISRAFMPGNVTWLSDVVTTQIPYVTTSYDKTNNTYYREHRVVVKNRADIHLGICAGEVGQAKRIFINGAEVVNLSLVASDAYIVTSGSESQKVRAELAEAVGFGRAPANRGIAMLILKDFDVGAFKRFPTFKIEVVTDVTNDPSVEETAAQTGLNTSNIWQVNSEAGTVFYEAVHKVRVSKYSNLETILDQPTDYAREVTPLGNIITIQSGTANVLYPNMAGAYGNFPLTYTDKTFLFHTFDNIGNDFLGLYTFDNSGALVVEQIDEVRGVFTTRYSIPSFDSEAPECALRLTYSAVDTVGIPTTTTSVFFLRGKAGVTDSVRVVEAKLSSDDNAAQFLRNGYVVTHDIPPSAFGNSADLTLKGAIPSTYDSSIVIFASSTTTNYIVKWSPSTGVIWTSTAPSLPNFGRYAQVKETTRKVFAFIAPDDETYSLNLEDGEVAHVEDTSNIFPGLLDGKQFYDPDTDSITYQSEDSKITRIYLSRKVITNATVGDAIREIARRANISSSYVSGVGGNPREIKGFRSGNALTGTEMIAQLNKVYPFALFSEDMIDVTLLGAVSLATVDEDDYVSTPSIQRTVETKENVSVELSYYDDDLNGDIAKQSFFADRFFDTGSRPIASSVYQWTVLETADYMRQLAELMAYTQTQLGNESGIEIPPRYLRFTVGDIVTLSSDTQRISGISVGANNALKVKIRAEVPSIYDDVISLSGVTNVAATSTNKKIQERFSAPLPFSLRGINPSVRALAYNYYGAYAPYGEFGDQARVAPTAKSTGTSPLSSPVTISEPTLWGRLIEAPPTLTVSFFQTFQTQRLRIKFPSLDFVARILSKQSYYGQSPDQRTMDFSYNLLAVGYELIQYGVATQDPTDDYTVIFTNLLRARNNTDANTAHTVGEFCAVIDESVGSYYLSGASVDAKAIAVNGSSIRRSSGQSRIEDTLPLTPYLISRQDWPSPSSGSTAFPGNPHVMIVVNHREENAIGFSDNEVNLAGILGSTRQMDVYLLRSTFNLSTFNAHRYGTSTSYIVFRGTTSGDITFGETGSPTFYHAALWSASSQSASAWNWAGEPLTAVVVDRNANGESLAYASWGAGALLRNRPHRGLNV